MDKKVKQLECYTVQFNEIFCPVEPCNVNIQRASHTDTMALQTRAKLKQNIYQYNYI